MDWIKLGRRTIGSSLIVATITAHDHKPHVESVPVPAPHYLTVSQAAQTTSGSIVQVNPFSLTGYTEG